MKNGLVVKDNALINASYNLEVTEQRLILLSIINARETGQGITADSKLEIHASDYAKQFNVSLDAAYKALKEAVNNLFERQFSFQEETKKGIGIVRSRWVSRIKYIDTSAILEITFAPDVVPLITRLEQHFTTYQIQQVTKLTGKYVIRLYEILIAWRDIGKVPLIELSDFRKKIGVEDNEYIAMNNFKNRVLEPAIKQINEHTDITVKYEQHKTGRTITGFSFSFKQKKEHQKPEPKQKIISDKQLDLFANKLAHDDAFSSQFSEVGESYENFAERIKIQLKDPTYLDKFSAYLDKLGLKV